MKLTTAILAAAFSFLLGVWLGRKSHPSERERRKYEHIFRKYFEGGVTPSSDDTKTWTFEAKWESEDGIEPWRDSRTDELVG